MSARNRPASLLISTLSAPVEVLITVTSAPGTTAPEGSKMVPLMAPFSKDWPGRIPGPWDKATVTAANMHASDRLVDSDRLVNHKMDKAICKTCIQPAPTGPGFR